jgi:hypothetical protein
MFELFVCIVYLPSVSKSSDGVILWFTQFTVIMVRYVLFFQPHTIAVLPYFTLVALNHQSNIIYCLIILVLIKNINSLVKFISIRVSPQIQRVVEPPSELPSSEVEVDLLGRRFLPPRLCLPFLWAAFASMLVIIVAETSLVLFITHSFMINVISVLSLSVLSFESWLLLIWVLGNKKTLGFFSKTGRNDGWSLIFSVLLSRWGAHLCSYYISLESKFTIMGEKVK